MPFLARSIKPVFCCGLLALVCLAFVPALVVLGAGIDDSTAGGISRSYLYWSAGLMTLVAVHCGALWYLTRVVEQRLS